MKKKKKTTDAVKILHNRYIKGDKKRLESIERERRKSDNDDIETFIKKNRMRIHRDRVILAAKKVPKAALRVVAAESLDNLEEACKLLADL